ncbi:MAG: hypothetical protein ABUL44_04035, partial [Flavobacterium sp.]
LDRLQAILDEANPSQKTLYIQSRIKDLRHHELSLRQYDMEDTENSEQSYHQLFKEFLVIEANFIRETRDLPESIPIPMLSAQPLAKTESPFLGDLVSIVYPSVQVHIVCKACC